MTGTDTKSRAMDILLSLPWEPRPISDPLATEPCGRCGRPVMWAMWPNGGKVRLEGRAQPGGTIDPVGVQEGVLIVSETREHDLTRRAFVRHTCRR
jgi:hypothetical protein